MATSKDVAKLAGVSHTTVSRAFRGNAKMKKETYERIMEVARELNYEPNAVAADLRSRKTNTVGIVIGSVETTFYMNMVQELETQLQKQGFRLLISFDGHDPDRQMNAFRAMAGARVGTIIFFPQERPPEEERRLKSWMRSSGIQFIQLFEPHMEEYSSVLIDDIGGTLLGTRHLLEQGHKRILMIGGYNRIQGFQKAYAERGEKPAIPHMRLLDDDLGVCRENIRKAIIQTKPTAVFSISDQMSVITYSVLTDLKYRVPEDMSFLAFDDSFWSQSLHISVIAQPITEISGNIADHVVRCNQADREQERITASKTTFMPYLIERNTICPI